jgi:hypothetical protein
MTEYVDAYRGRPGVEPICRVLAPATGGFMKSHGYRATKKTTGFYLAVPDQVLGGEVAHLHAGDYGVYGAQKMARLMQRQSLLLGHDRVARVIKPAGITGVRRGRTTFSTGSCQSWAANITYVAPSVGLPVSPSLPTRSTGTFALVGAANCPSREAAPASARHGGLELNDDLTGRARYSTSSRNYVSPAYTD